MKARSVASELLGAQEAMHDRGWTLRSVDMPLADAHQLCEEMRWPVPPSPAVGGLLGTVGETQIFVRLA